MLHSWQQQYTDNACKASLRIAMRLQRVQMLFPILNWGHVQCEQLQTVFALWPMSNNKTSVCWNSISKLMNRSQSNFREYLLCLRRLPPPQSETVHTPSSSMPNLSNIGHNMLWRGESCSVETGHTQPVQYWPRQCMCGCTSVETGHTPPHPSPRVQQEGAICG